MFRKHRTQNGDRTRAQLSTKGWLAGRSLNYQLMTGVHGLAAVFGITPIFCAKAMKRGSSL